VRSVIVPDEILLEPELFVDLLAKHGVTRIVLVPSFLRAILRAVPDLGRRLPTLRLWSVSGEVFPPDLAEKFHRLFGTYLDPDSLDRKQLAFGIGEKPNPVRLIAGV
jgi:non-ribosomal peptide synthetase component F